MFDPCFVLQYAVPFLGLCNNLIGEEIAGCFTLIIFLMSCDCYRFI